MGRDVVDFNADDETVTNTGQFIAAVSPGALVGDVVFVELEEGIEGLGAL